MNHVIYEMYSLCFHSKTFHYDSTRILMKWGISMIEHFIGGLLR